MCLIVEVYFNNMFKSLTYDNYCTVSLDVLRNPLLQFEVQFSQATWFDVQLISTKICADKHHIKICCKMNNIIMGNPNVKSKFENVHLFLCVRII